MEKKTIEEKHITVLKGSVFQPEGANYQVDSLESLINLVKRKGSPEKTVLFYHEKGVDVILDDTVEHRDKDMAFLRFKLSPALGDWNFLRDRWVSQKALLDFLFIRDEREFLSVSKSSLINLFEKLKLATTIIGDYQYTDNNNYTVMFKIKDGEDSVTLPSMIEIKIPFFLGSEAEIAIEVKLELAKPTSAEEKPLFRLPCPKYWQYFREAVEYEIDKLKKALPEHLILAGAYSYSN